MLTLDDIQRGIDEIIEHGNNRDDIHTLADLFTCLAGMKQLSTHTPTNTPTEYSSESEFGRCICGKDMDKVLAVMDELMETLSVLNRRLYDGVLAQLNK